MPRNPPPSAAHPAAFEPPPREEAEAKPAGAPARAPADATESYRVEVNGKVYEVKVGPSGQVTEAAPAAPAAAPAGEVISAPLAGAIVKVKVTEGQRVRSGDVVLILEAMKMETEVRAPRAGTVARIHVKEADAVQVGDPLLSLD